MATGKREVSTDEIEGTSLAEREPGPNGDPPSSEHGAPEGAPHASGPMRSSRYFELFDTAPVGYLTLRDGDVVCDVNTTGARLLGMERTGVAGRSFLDFVEPEDRDAYRRYVQALHGTCALHTVELRLRRTHAPGQSGDTQTHFWARLAGWTHGDADGETLDWVTFTDFDREKRAEDVVAIRARIGQYALGASLDEVIQRVLDEAESATESTIGFMHFVDEDQQSLLLQAWSTNTLATQCDAEAKGAHYSVEQAGVWADCLRERRPIIHNDYVSLPNREGLPEGHAKLVRELTVPLFEGSKVRMIIGVGNRPTEYDSSDVDAVTQIATAALDIVHAKRVEEDLGKTRLLLQSVADGTSDAVFVKDLQGRYLLFNKAAEQATGKKAEDVIGRDDTVLFPSDEADTLMAGDQAVIEGGVTTTLEERLTRPGKGLGVYSATKGPVRDSNGVVYGLFGISRDVTQQSVAEDALLESERWLSESQRIARLGHYVYDIVNDWWECSPALCELFGIGSDYKRNLEGWLGIVHPADRGMMSKYFLEDVLGMHVPFDLEYRILRPSDAVERWVHGRGTVEWGDEGQPLEMFGIIQDITESKQAQLALRERNAFIEEALDSAPIGFALNAIDDGRSVFVGKSFERIYGVEPGSLGDVDRFFEQVYRDPVVREKMRERIVKDIASGDPSRMRWENVHITTHSGHERVITATNIPLAEQNLMISTVEDVTERWHAEQALRESETRFRAVFEGATDGIWLVRTDGTLAFANPSMATMHGYTLDELLSLNLAALDTPETHQLAPERLERLFAGESLSFEAEHFCKSGERFPLEVSAGLVRLGGEMYVLAFHRDITERKRAEEELERRGAMLGELAEERERHLEKLAESLASIIGVVGLIVETRDPYTAGHERRVSELSVRIAQELGMPDDDVERIRIAGLLHDVGKISIPAEILSKPGRLTEIEFTLIKCHAADSYRILTSANVGTEIAEMVYQHHERCDGSGYPRGLGESELVEGAKVLMVADVVEAMSTDRPYRASLGIEPALAEIERGAGQQYDSTVAAACQRVFESGFEFSEASADEPNPVKAPAPNE